MNKKIKKITKFSFTVDNNLEMGRSIIHDINFMYSTGQTTTLNIEYEDGTTEEIRNYNPLNTKNPLQYKRI
jgi:hypothetical protein